MNYMFLDKYDIRDYLDKQVGIKVTDEIFDVIDKSEEEYNKEKKNLEEYSRYIDLLEESVGNLSTCLDKIDVSLRNIESILLSASNGRKISKKLYKEVVGEMNCIKEYINDVDEDRHQITKIVLTSKFRYDKIKPSKRKRGKSQWTK